MDKRQIFERGILPLITISRIFGNFPLKFDESVKVSIYSILYGVILIIFNLTFVIIRSQEPEYVYGSVFVKITSALHPIVVCLAAISFLCHAGSFSKIFNEVFDYLNLVEIKKLKYLIWGMNLLIVTFQVYLILSFIVFSKNLKAAEIIHVVLLYNLSNSLLIMTLWIFLIVSMLLLTFMGINKKLEKASEIKLCGSETCKKWVSRYEDDDGEKIFKFLLNNYLKVVTTCEKVNDCFGFTSAGIALNITIDCAVMLFSTIVYPLDFFNLIILIARLIFDFLSEYLMLTSCEYVTREVSF